MYNNIYIWFICYIICDIIIYNNITYIVVYTLRNIACIQYLVVVGDWDELRLVRVACWRYGTREAIEVLAATGTSRG